LITTRIGLLSKVGLLNACLSVGGGCGSSLGGSGGGGSTGGGSSGSGGSGGGGSGGGSSGGGIGGGGSGGPGGPVIGSGGSGSSRVDVAMRIRCRDVVGTPESYDTSLVKLCRMIRG
jgi:hypothetical protein